MPNVYQPSFAGGELKPSLHQRTDISKYGVSCRVLLNYIVHAGGGVSNRAGTKYINRAKYADRNTRLIPFEFNTEQAYALEFGDEYMRVLRDGGHVLETAQNITAITQANPGVVTITGHTFTDGMWVFVQSIVGMTELNGDFYLIANATANTFTLQDLDGNDIDTTAYTAYSSGGTVSAVYEISTPYDHEDLALLKFVQSADVMTFVHPDYAPRELSRTGHASWTLAQIEFLPNITHPDSMTIAESASGSGTVYKYKVTAVDEETTEESLPGTDTTTVTITGATQADPVVISATNSYNDGDEVYIDGIVGMTELNGKRFTVDNASGSDFELKGIDGTGYAAYTSGGTAARTHMEIDSNLGSNTITVGWAEVAGASKYNVYKESNGIYGYIGSTELLSFTDDNITPEVDDTPPRSRNPFDGTGNNPGTVNLYEQRRTFARTDNFIDKVFTSQTSNYANMNVSSPAKADDALTFTLAGNKVNEIRHLVTLGDLIAFTSGGEWTISGADNQPLQPDTINAQQQSGRGASHVPPIVIGNTALYNQARGKKIRDFRYTFESDGYDGNDVSILASHLFKKTRAVDKRLKEWAYQQEPDSLVWCVHKDGSLSSLTYEREHEVAAFSRHDTEGSFVSVCCIPEDDVDRVYFVTERTNNNGTYQFLEMMENREIEEDDLNYAYFVDCGITIEGNGSTTISGLNWLEGMEVCIWADGNDLPKQNVVNGSVTLDKVYTTISIGLPYNCDMQPMDIEFQLQAGHTKGVPKKVNKLYLHLYNARAIKVYAKNPEANNLDPDEMVKPETFKQREWEDYDEPTQLKTGIVELEVRSEWQYRAAPYIRHDSPSPISIMAIAPQIELGGD